MRSYHLWPILVGSFLHFFILYSRLSFVLFIYLFIFLKLYYILFLGYFLIYYVIWWLCDTALEVGKPSSAILYKIKTFRYNS